MADASSEAIHREFYNRSRDIIRVFNPLEIDFKFKYDSVWYKIPAKGTKDWERYLAKHYVEQASQYIIGQMAMEKGTKMLEERQAKGLAEILNKYDENRMIWDNTPRIDNKELRENLSNQLILGIVEEFGAEAAPEENYSKPDPVNNPLNKSVGEMIFDKVANKRIQEIIDAPAPQEVQVRPLKKVEKKLEQEVTTE